MNRASFRNDEEYYQTVQSIRKKIQSQQRAQENKDPTPLSSPSTKKSVLVENVDPDPPRRPLYQASDNNSKINKRVKEIESVYDRIQTALSQKRRPSVTQNITPSQKPASLFNIAPHVSVSKVAEDDELAQTVSFTPRAEKQYSTIQQVSFKREYKNNGYMSRSPAVEASPQMCKELIPVSLSGKKGVSRKETIVSNYEEKQSSNSGSIKLLIQQVQLDLLLRPLREQFDGFRNENKWNELIEYCQAKGMKATKQQIEAWVKISHQEFDPFRSTAIPKDFPYRELVAAFNEAKTHWEKVVRGSLLPSQADCPELTLGDSFGLEGLVCCLNMTSDSCLRNRDVFAMFGRMRALQREGAVRVRKSTLLSFLRGGQ